MSLNDISCIRLTDSTHLNSNPPYSAAATPCWLTSLAAFFCSASPPVSCPLFRRTPPTHSIKLRAKVNMSFAFRLTKQSGYGQIRSGGGASACLHLGASGLACVVLVEGVSLNDQC